MGRWITGDLHVHSNCCHDGSLPVVEVARRAARYCDFLAISGHARNSDHWGIEQYKGVVAAREAFPDMPIFHVGELEFPIERHAMIVTPPGNHEFEIQQELVAQFDRRNGAVGIETALAELAYVEDRLGLNCFMVFNHPNAPDVSFEDLDALAASDVFKVIACVDRGERRAKQTWDIGGEWDQLLSRGHHIFARYGSDFHKHFHDGGRDYYPGEFVQDHLWVENLSYDDIVKAYRSGTFYCTVDNLISSPVFTLGGTGSDPEIALSFKVNSPIERVDIISDGESVASFHDVRDAFSFTGKVPVGRYYRVRGVGAMKPRRYEEGEFEPSFLLNPIFPG